MNVLLINPPFFSLLGYPPISDYPPTGLCYLAAVLEMNDVKVSVLNAETMEFQKTNWLQRLSFLNLHKLRVGKDIDLVYKEITKSSEHEVWKKMCHEIKRHNPDLIGITTLTSTFRSALSISKIVKEWDQDLPIVFGGPHSTVLPEKSLQNSSLDFVIKGEGEITLLELIHALEGKMRFDQVRGLSFRRNNEIQHNPDRPWIDNLDEIPFPAKHLVIDKEKLLPIHFGRLFTSRGCPYNCIFCNSRSLWGRKIRYRSPENVLEEIIFTIQQYGTRYFYFDDDTFTINKKRTLNLCDLIIENQLDIKWWCETRVNVMDNALLKKMKKAGCDRISIGVESGDPKILEKIKKGITIEQVKAASKLLHKNGLKFHAFFMTGFPWETEKEIKNTVSLMKEIDPDYAYLSVATPYPGTELRNILLREGFDMSEEWEDYYHSRPAGCYTLNISQREFSKLESTATKIFQTHNMIKILKGVLFRDARFRIWLSEAIKRYLDLI